MTTGLSYYWEGGREKQQCEDNKLDGKKKNLLRTHTQSIAIPRIFQQLTPKKSLETFWPKYRLSIVIGLPGNVAMGKK